MDNVVTTYPPPDPGPVDGVQERLDQLQALIDDLVMTQLGEKEEPYGP